MAASEFQEIVNDFEFLEDWDDRYRYIIDLGKNLVPLENFEKNDLNKVNGCASQVWLTFDIKGEGDSQAVFFKGDSDSIIVKGLISIVLTLLNGEKVSVAKTIDMQAELKKLELEEHLSSQRSNGLMAMIDKITSTINNLK